MSNSEEVLTQRGKRKYLYEGCSFTLAGYNVDNTTVFWRCCRRTSGCRVRIHTDNYTNQVVKVINNHNHDQCAPDVLATKVKNAVKRRAEETMELPSQVINNETAKFGSMILPLLSKRNLQRMIQRKRNCYNRAPPNPLSLAELEIPESYKTYTPIEGQHERFLLHDSGSVDGPNRILIFGRKVNVCWAGREGNEVTQMYLDGTFKITPSLYRDGQLYVLLVKKNAWVFPVLYALLPNKTRTTYSNFFRIVQDLMPNLEPCGISMDFDTSAFKAAQAAFPRSQIFACLYHFVENFKTKLCSNGTALSLYRSNAEFALSCRMVMALAFVPLQRLDEGVATLEEFLPSEALFLLDWLEDNYIGRRRIGRERRSPLFPPQMWNANERLLSDHDRTYNFAEAAHHCLQVELGVGHPIIWKLIDGLKKVQKSRDLEYERMMAGRSPPAKWRKYQEADKRILKLVKQFAGMDDNHQQQSMLEFLRGIGHSVEMDA